MLVTRVVDMLACDPKSNEDAHDGNFGTRATDEFGVNFRSVMSFVSHETGRNVLCAEQWDLIVEQLAFNGYFAHEDWPAGLEHSERTGTWPTTMMNVLQTCSSGARRRSTAGCSATRQVSGFEPATSSV